MKSELVTVTELAIYFERDVRTIQLWAEDGMPKHARGKYDKDECAKWKIKKLEEENEILRTVGDKKLYDLKIKDQAIKNKKGEIDLKKMLAQVVEKRSVLIAWSNQNSVINSKIDTLKNDVLREVKENLNEKQVKKLREHFNEVKDSISKLQIEEYIINEDKIHTEQEEENE